MIYAYISIGQFICQVCSQCIKKNTYLNLLPSKLHINNFLHFLFPALTFRHRASCILGQAFRYSPENAFYIFNQQMYFII